MAISTYSRFPVPSLSFKPKDMRYTMIFFPLVGIIIGMMEYVWMSWSVRLSSELVRALIAAAIPLLTAGSIHLDGFVDTCDALACLKGRESKLSIMKDPHIGGGALAGALVYYFFFLSSLCMIRGERAIVAFALSFFLSRIMSAIGVVSFKSAKREGMLFAFSDSAQKKAVRFALYLEFIACALFMLTNLLETGFFVLIANTGFMYLYIKRCMKELGGVTGDTQGFFLIVSEGLSAAVIAVTFAFR